MILNVKSVSCSLFANTFEGKKYNLCTFLSDDSILEECLLAKAVEKGKEAVRAF